MYTKTILASAALMATTALASTPGSAVIVNACTYPVYLSAVPASGGGYEESSKTLAPKETWSTPYKQLSNGNGWSLKLSKSSVLHNILQYEYTYHNDGTIWYDLSAVDGNPWNSNWQISAKGGSGCTPKQAWYRYDTDDAFGMQSCNDDATITVTVCSGESQADAVVSAVVAAVTQAAAPVLNQAPAVAIAAASPTTTTTAAAAPVTTQAAASTAQAVQLNGNQLVNPAVSSKAAASPTTLATVVSPAAAVDTEVVTEIVTVVETAIAYATYTPEKRHIHHPNHPHNA